MCTVAVLEGVCWSMATGNPYQERRFYLTPTVSPQIFHVAFEFPKRSKNHALQRQILLSRPSRPQLADISLDRTSRPVLPSLLRTLQGGSNEARMAYRGAFAHSSVADSSSNATPTRPGR